GEWDYWNWQRSGFGLTAYAFADAGLIGRPLRSIAEDAAAGQVLLQSGLLADAGLGFLFKAKALKPGRQPFTLRLDCPLFLNAVPAGDDYFKPRLVLGVGRSW
ncbi:MAG: hypothetical protein ACO3DK_09385, partial [Bacteroidia bacterium]